MNEKIVADKPIVDTYDRRGISGYADLECLALNLLWSWNHCGDKLWKELDPTLWEITHNPWVVLQTVSKEQLEAKLADPKFREVVDTILQANKEIIQKKTWFQTKHANSPLKCIAYFCMEYMLSEALPIYSGGLGNVAGDQLKAASVLGIPVVAIGLLYQRGYFRQMIDQDGSQQAYYPFNAPGQLPITPLRKSNGEWLRLEISFPGYSVWLRAWQVQVGIVKLYLLDSNDPANFPPYRTITSELYGGGPDLRLKQEMILGIGGYRLLTTLGIKPEVCHLNECHAAFVVLERARTYMQETGTTFELALEATRAGNLFTTHTAVSAGFDRFSPSMLEKHLGYYTKERLGISFNDLLALGRQNPNDPNEFFNMAYLAIRGSGAINGVSRLHAKVSRELFSPLFPRYPVDEVPVSYVTNGVHTPSWDSAQSDDLWAEGCGNNRWLGSTEKLEEDFRRVPPEKIWQMRNAQRNTLVEFTRNRAARQLAFLGASEKDLEKAKQIFNPNTLTLGFARRFATYKRPNMLLHDPERLLRILNNPERPVQLIIAGKAHPADIPGQNLIKEWNQFIKKPETANRVVFLEDYDMLLTEKLVQGVDVWINTPRRPWEACGTSGMKVLVNGGLNLSELDGWWVEAYTPEVGWALGDGQEHGDDPAWDAAEANTLYDILEQEVIPQFYKRDEKGLPTVWLTKIKESMARLTPHYSANRTVQEYTEKHYIPSAIAYKERSSNKDIIPKQVIDWKHNLAQKWPSIQFLSSQINVKGNQYEFEVKVNLDDLDPSAVQVELYANGQNGDKPELNIMTNIGRVAEGYVYKASIPSTRPYTDYTPRVIPKNANAPIPLEANEILWQK